jgi:polysaccharide deacetylase 2 family uncharacterized protein YibQ
MAQKSKKLDRRNFLLKSAASLVGSVLGLGPLSNAWSAPCRAGGPYAFEPKIALIIDDIGFSVNRARQFLELSAPLTFSVLPWLHNSYDLAQEIHDHGHEIMLHQPMEPFNPSIDPGPGALFVGDNPTNIVGTMEKNVLSVPHAIGVNNHMGSKFTACRKEMLEALSVVKEMALFFIDSVTSSRSTAYKTAKELHVDCAFRNRFLDTRLSIGAILRELERLKDHARTYGRAIGIGHPFPETCHAIALFLKTLPNNGISVVPVSCLVQPTKG